jgi:hypothetical protein
MTNQTDSPCSGPVYDLAKRFVGTWQEFTVKADGEELDGTLVSEFDVGGCVFVQRFTSVDGSFTFMAFAYVDPTANRWHETYVMSNGRTASYWWIEQGDNLIIERIGGDPANLRRLIVQDFRDDFYASVEERSVDSGKTWEPLERTHARRIG